MIILPILTTSLVYFSLEGWENVLFELGTERVNLFPSSLRKQTTKKPVRWHSHFLCPATTTNTTRSPNTKSEHNQPRFQSPRKTKIIEFDKDINIRSFLQKRARAVWPGAPSSTLATSCTWSRRPGEMPETRASVSEASSSRSCQRGSSSSSTERSLLEARVGSDCAGTCRACSTGLGSSLLFTGTGFSLPEVIPTLLSSAGRWRTTGLSTACGTIFLAIPGCHSSVRKVRWGEKVWSSSQREMYRSIDSDSLVNANLGSRPLSSRLWRRAMREVWNPG